jgi:hypothetical protein
MNYDIAGLALHIEEVHTTSNVVRQIFAQDRSTGYEVIWIEVNDTPNHVLDLRFRNVEVHPMFVCRNT